MKKDTVKSFMDEGFVFTDEKDTHNKITRTHLGVKAGSKSKPDCNIVVRKTMIKGKPMFYISFRSNIDEVLGTHVCFQRFDDSLVFRPITKDIRYTPTRSYAIQKVKPSNSSGTHVTTNMWISDSDGLDLFDFAQNDFDPTYYKLCQDKYTKCFYIKKGQNY